jgi:polysaccharide export outer membrane protein
MITGGGMRSFILTVGAVAQLTLLGACTNRQEAPTKVETPDVPPMYQIGAGDTLTIFVWRNAELTTTVTVRPDGRISVPLIEDLYVEGRTPSELSREIEKRLGDYVQDPLVTVTVGGFIGTYPQQVRIVGQATQPMSIPYRANMTLLDAVIQAGGLTEFADGNSTILVRMEKGAQKEYRVYLDDLLKDGDISANLPLLPGDILIIPETFF